MTLNYFSEYKAYEISHVNLSVIWSYIWLFTSSLSASRKGTQLLKSLRPCYCTNQTICNFNKRRRILQEGLLLTYYMASAIQTETSHGNVDLLFEIGARTT
ncbi:hypothetical protein VTL71DRAFT_15334, partial [Oculimacula yallundae]